MSKHFSKHFSCGITLLVGLFWSAVSLADSMQPIVSTRAEVGWLGSFDWPVFATAAAVATTVTVLWGLGAATQQRLSGSSSQN